MNWLCGLPNRSQRYRILVMQLMCLPRRLINDHYLRYLSFVGGFRAPGDNMLVHYFKSQFNRMRPSTRYKSFSFPSGHSASGELIDIVTPHLSYFAFIHLAQYSNKSFFLILDALHNVQIFVCDKLRNRGCASLWVSCAYLPLLTSVFVCSYIHHWYAALCNSSLDTGDHR